MQLEREKGFEPGISPDVSGTYAAPLNASQSPTRPLDASAQVETDTFEHDTGEELRALPDVAAELFVEAGFNVALRATVGGVSAPALERIVRRAVEQATALRDEAGRAFTPSLPLP